MNNWMKTSTINLFDKHIQSVTLYGSNVHFHSPSEHSIDGQLMDLEMHVVHRMDPFNSPRSLQLSISDEQAEELQISQFIAGVIGFLFKVKPDRYFDKILKENPISNIDYHDRFLERLVAEEANAVNRESALQGDTSSTELHKKSDKNKKIENAMTKASMEKEDEKELDLAEFVSLLNYDRRWTYQGSLTSAPCQEGILWNVLEQVIPIRQSTLDKFTELK